MGTLFRILSYFSRLIPINRWGFKSIPIYFSKFYKGKLGFIFFAKNKIKWSAEGFPDVFTRHMIFEGVYQSEVIEAFDKVINKGDTIIDCGGHHGLMAIFAALKVTQTGKVISFEPNPIARSFFEKNILLNEITNIKIEPIALSNTKGEISFFIQSGNISWNSTIIKEFSHGMKEIKVVSDTLDDYVIFNNLTPSLIKIDVEGAEMLILEGAKKTIQKFKPLLSMEFNADSAKAAGVSLDSIYNFLYSIGYELFILNRNLLGNYNFNNKTLLSTKNNQSSLCNVICIPKK